MNKEDKIKLYEMKKKNPWLALAFSLLFTGSGHWYTGRTGRGFAFLLAQIGLWFILMGWIMWIWSPIDAYNVTNEHNELLKIDLGIK